MSDNPQGHGPSREALEAAARAIADPRPIPLRNEDEDAEKAVDAAYPVIRRDVAREIAEWLRDQVTTMHDETTVLYRPAFQLVADLIAVEFVKSDE